MSTNNNHKNDKKKGNPKDKYFRKGKGGNKNPKGGNPKENGGYKPPKDNGDSPDLTPPGSEQDPFWYAKDAQAIADFGSLPFTDVSGAPFPGFSGGNREAANPGIVVIPTTFIVPGTEPSGLTDGDNFATRAANAYLQYLAQGFSANFDFEAPDLMMTAIAGSALYAALADGVRAFGCMNYYLQSNNYWAKKVVEALGYDFDDFKRNRKTFVSEFNIRVDQINKTIAVPKQFFIGERWRYLTANIFAENVPVSYATVFAYVPDSIIMYDGYGLDTGTSLKYQQFTRGTVEEYFNFIDTLIASLTGDDQRNMFGALRRVYGEGDLVTLNTIDSSFTTEVTYNPVQSVQWHNSIHVFHMDGYGPDRDERGGGICVYQTPDGKLESQYYVVLNASTNYPRYGQFDLSTRIISLCGLQDTPAVLLDITANSGVVDLEDELLNSQDSTSMGYRYYGRCEVLKYPIMYVGDAHYTTKPYIISGVWDDSMTNTVTDMSRINRHPLLYVFASNTSEPTEPIDVIGEVDQYTTVSAEYLKSLHRKCAYQLLAMPANSKSITK